MDNLIRLDREQQQQLDHEKVQARKQLLAMPPFEAQKIAASSIYSSHWSVAPQNLTWDESLSLIDDDFTDS
ncbi:hypothetical protein C7H19_25100 [Aphanothece hegewaldii CCALA 016]|uniref:Uncharacterized protein n=1 Tax=Aphanothece hegewaldii CCALA 016 TaxID=2107694 RepID=A0A2T1LQD0_9CHRO|nr:hypothetical protein [Aphanothece hegewaldii]PSF26708.1 hypothetical protein C7H19_25100 [Aphanothece hegewaldii CCALA 016]